jgi:prepilin-type N-terminal cleavage/methylation domain-containing protein
MSRRAFSLIELLVVLVILTILMALLMTAVQRVRMAANRTVCANNLHQIALAIYVYHDANRVLPYARLCPEPWLGGKDPFCLNLPSPDTYTGPDEVWWAPYDNRPGTDPTQALSDYTPHGILWDYLEGQPRTFRCPDGIDTTQGSPTQGKMFQVSYTLNPAMGGKRLEDVSFRGNFAWDHMDLPNCGTVQGHWTAWQADSQQVAGRHEPPRHGGVLNSVGAGGAVSARRLDE